jgi:hypothetical protein
VVALALRDGSIGRETKRVVHAPPPGWHVRRHREECAAKYGPTSDAASGVPDGWHWTSDAEAKDVAAGRAELAAPYHGLVAQAGARVESREEAADRASASASHHALVAEAEGRGAGLLRGGSGIAMTVSAELVCVGP